MVAPAARRAYGRCHPRQPVADMVLPFGPFRSYEPFPCTILAREEEHMATSAERMRALRERETPRTSEIDDLRERGRSPRDCGVRLRRRRKHRPRSAGASRRPLHNDMLAVSTGQGNGLTTVATPFQ